MRMLSKSVALAAFVAMAAPLTPVLAMQDEAAATPQGLSPEQQSSYMTWPEDTKAYYASLSREHQSLFWALSDEDKVTLSRMEPEQRDDIMRQLEERMKGAAPQGR